MTRWERIGEILGLIVRLFLLLVAALSMLAGNWPQATTFLLLIIMLEVIEIRQGNR